MFSTAVAKAIQAGRATGKYNLTGRQLDALPAELWDENLPLPVADPKVTQGVNWWEVSAPQRLEVSRNRCVCARAYVLHTVLRKVVTPPQESSQAGVTSDHAPCG